MCSHKCICALLTYSKQNDRTLDLHNMQVAPCPLPNSFEILAEKSFVVTASDDKQRDKWYKAIQQEISNLGLQEGRVETAAVWKQDRMVSGCLICHNTFNLVRRRHHCRKCGEVVCDPCSKHRMPMNIVVPTSDATTPQRVCDNCIGDLRVRIPTMSSQSNMNGIARSRSARGLAGVDLDLSLPKSQLSSADMTKRQHIAHELFMTEKTYVTMLTNLRELFTDPMLADAEARVPKIGKICRLTSEDKLTSMSVFLSSVRQIQTLNAQVFQELHQGIGINNISINETGNLEIIYDDGEGVELGGELRGVKGSRGDRGIGINNVTVNTNGNLQVNLDEGEPIEVIGEMTGVKGDLGDQGRGGQKGQKGEQGNIYVLLVDSRDVKKLVNELSDEDGNYRNIRILNNDSNFVNDVRYKKTFFSSLEKYLKKKK